MRSQILFIFIFCINSFIIQAQSIVQKSETLYYKDIKGSPYLSDSFQLGTVFLKNKELVKTKIRYDIYADEIEFIKENRIFHFEKKEIDSIYIENQKLIVSDIYFEYEQKLSYLIVLYQGKYSFLLKKTVRFDKNKFLKSYTEPKSYRFTPSTDYFFIKFSFYQPVLIKNKKSFKKEFPILFNKLSEFIKKENISFSEQNDLLKLVSHINSMY